MENTSAPPTLLADSPVTSSVSTTSDGSLSNAPVRNADGKFLPGKSGNPSGKAVGIQHKITLRKRELEHAVREVIKPSDVRKVWNRIVQDALEGSNGAQKLVLEYSMSKVSDLIEKDRDNAPTEYVFYVVDSRVKGEKDVSDPETPPAIEGQFTQVDEDRNGPTE